MDRTTTLEIVAKLLTETMDNDDLPIVICQLLRPFCKPGANKTKKTAKLLESILIRHQICIKCRDNKTRQQNDAYCDFCKKIFRDQIKGT